MSDIEFKSALQVALRNAEVDIHVSKLNVVILADAALAVVQKRAEQLADECDGIAAMEGILHPESLASYRAASKRIRSVFGLATREETNQ